MSNYVLTLHHERCPDGAELAPHPWVRGATVTWPSERHFVRPEGAEGPISNYPVDGVLQKPLIRFRSERREDYRRRLETPDQLIVTKFINTITSEETPEGADYTDLISFVNEYGFPQQDVRLDRLIRDQEKWEREMQKLRSDRKPDNQHDPPVVENPLSESNGEMQVSLLTELRDELGEIWSAYEEGELNKAVDSFRGLAIDDLSGLQPDIEFRDGKPALTLPISTLYGFMLMETALVITGGSKVMRCAECGTIFITGSGTGRRGTSLYCTNRCRVAAQRSRESTSASLY
jgi:hypothetical protein